MADPTLDPQTDDRIQLLNQCGFFDRLGREGKAEITDELDLVVLSAGQALFRQGEPGDSMYIVDRGLLEVRVVGADGAYHVIDRLDSGESVGEMALITGRPRSADVVAIVDSQLVRLPKTSFDRMAERHPALFNGFAWAMMPRVQRGQLGGILAGLFGELDPAALRDLQSRLSWLRLSSGERLFSQGEAGAVMYIVVNGRLQFVAEPAPEDAPYEPPRVLGEVGAGDTIGEFSLLTDEPRSATVYAVRDSDLVMLTRPVFEALIKDHPQAMVEITRRIVRRQQRSLGIGGGDTAALSLAVIPAGGGAPIEAFARELAQRLAPDGKVQIYTSESFDEAYGRPGASTLEADDPLTLVVNSWLREQEARHDVLLFVAHPELDEWTRRCLGQADRVIAAARADEDPALNPIERSLYPRLRRDLVLLHPATTSRPTHTAAWLEGRPGSPHYHVREGDEASWARLGRLLTGRPVGAVFSGGAARGLAHAGVINALEEAGQPVDIIAGSSMGSLLGGLWAIDTDRDGFLALAHRFSNPKAALDRTLPISALMASKKFTTILEEIFRELQVEDLWRPFFCVATNLSYSRPMVIESGPMWRAVRASAALPGIFTPVLTDANEMLVDGSVMNNFPVDILRERFPAGLVIGSNVSPHREKPSSYHFGESISGWGVLWSRINPFVEPEHVPTLGATLLRSLEVNSAYRRKSALRQVDIYIEPDVAEFGILDFAAYEALDARGYEAARAALGAYKGK